MCLESITKVYPKKDKTEGFGWKVFFRYKRKLHTVILAKPIEKGKIYRRRIETILSDYNISYDSGFHIFTTRDEARIYHCDGEVIRKVKYKGIVCDGYECGNGIMLNTRVVKQLELV